MGDEKYYKAPQLEYDSGVIDDALLTKATVLAGGDTDRAKFEYLKLRVERLKKEKVERVASAAVDAGKIIAPAAASFGVYLLRGLAVVVAIFIIIQAIN